MEVDAVEIRVLGCLIEKQRTTPDQYPLSLNALRLACNQTTNRDPVVEYDERTIKAALDRMAHREWTRFASGASSRALKYRHLLDQALGLSDAQLAVLAVLMLRGARRRASSSNAPSGCTGSSHRTSWSRPSTASRDGSSSRVSTAARVRRRSATSSFSAVRRKSRRLAPNPSRPQRLLPMSKPVCRPSKPPSRTYARAWTPS